MHTAVAALYAREDAEMPSQVWTTARRQASVSSRSLQNYPVRSADDCNRSLFDSSNAAFSKIRTSKSEST